MDTCGSERPVSDRDEGPAGGANAPDARLLFPVVEGTHAKLLMGLAVDLAQENEMELFVVVPVTVPDQTPIDLPGAYLEEHRKLATQLLRSADAELSANGIVRVGHDLESVVATAAEDLAADEVILEDVRESTPLEVVRGTRTERILSRLECDAVAVSRVERLRSLSSILVAVAGGPHSGLAIDVARTLAGANDAWVELFHVLSPDASDERRREATSYLDAAADRLGDFDSFDTWTIEAADAAEAIVEQSEYYDLTVMGAPTKGRLQRFVFGSTTGRVREEAECPVVVARRPSESSWLDHLIPGGDGA